MPVYKPRISNTLAVLLITVAVVVDVAQLLFSLIGFLVLGIALNSLASIFAATFFGIVLSMKEVSFITPERITLTMATLVSEILPIANNIPMWTLSVLFAIKSSRKEDQKHFERYQQNILHA